MSIQCLPHHCILEAENLFSGSTNLQMERNYAPRMDHTPSLTIPDLDYLDDKIWDILGQYLDEILDRVDAGMGKNFGDVGIM